MVDYFFGLIGRQIQIYRRVIILENDEFGKRMNEYLTEVTETMNKLIDIGRKYNVNPVIHMGFLREFFDEQVESMRGVVNKFVLEVMKNAKPKEKPKG